MGVAETLLHTHDIMQGLSVDWLPPAPLSSAVLEPMPVTLGGCASLSSVWRGWGRSGRLRVSGCQTGLRSGLLTQEFPPGLVDEVIAETGRAELRSRLLPARGSW